MAARTKLNRWMDDRFIEGLVTLVTKFRRLSLENSLLFCRMRVMTERTTESNGRMKALSFKHPALAVAFVTDPGVFAP